MKARLTFAISMAIDFDVYIIDEVSAAGDKVFRAKTQKMLENKYKESDFLIVDHSFNSIRKFCNRFFVLNNKNIVEFTKFNEAYDFYNSI